MITSQLLIFGFFLCFFFFNLYLKNRTAQNVAIGMFKEALNILLLHPFNILNLLNFIL